MWMISGMTQLTYINCYHKNNCFALYKYDCKLSVMIVVVYAKTYLATQKYLLLIKFCIFSFLVSCMYLLGFLFDLVQTDCPSLNHIWTGGSQLHDAIFQVDIYFRGTQCQFLENICLEDNLRSRIFGTFVVKCLACLPLLGFWNI